MKNVFRVLALFAPLAQFAAAFIASSAVEFNRPDTDDLITVPLYLEPGGFAFVIWPVIFISFILFGFYQFSKLQKNDGRFLKGRKYIILSCLGNIIWFYGDVNNALSICMIGFSMMLISLILLNNVFDLGNAKRGFKERWLVKMPISIFFAWITVAFPIGMTLFLIKDLGLTGRGFLNPQIWSAIIIAVALIIFSTLYITKKVSSFFVGVGSWGLFWIFLENNGQQPLIAYSALAAFLLLVSLIVIRKAKQWKSNIFKQAML